MRKEECRENKGWDLSKKCPKRGEIQGKARKNRISGLKRVTCPRKIAGIWIQNGRMGKKIDVRTGKNGSEPSKNRPKSDPERGKTRKKWASQGKKREQFLEKSPEVGPKTRKDEKKVDFTGQKTSACPRKIARNRVRNGEKREKRRFWSEKGGVGERRKNGLYCRFCNAMKWQNGRKWNFLAIFFGDLLQGMQKCPTFALAIGKQRSCKRGLRSESDEAAKALLWSLKVLHNRL